MNTHVTKAPAFAVRIKTAIEHGGPRDRVMAQRVKSCLRIIPTYLRGISERNVVC